MKIWNLVDKKLLKNIDWLLIITTVIIAVIGIACVGAATNSYMDGMSRNVKIQILALLIGAIAMVITTMINYNNYYDWSAYLYGIAIFFLVLVLFVGKSVAGATSWIEIGSLQFQPAELMKLALIIFLAKHLEAKKNDINTFADLIPGAFIAGVPLALVLLQPDFGTAMVMVFIVFVMYFVAGIDYKLLLKIVLPVITIVPPMMWMFFMKDYQKKRILVFLNPGLDPRGDGYNVLQSIISIGSGKLNGYGITSPDTSEYVKFIPIKESDFIFSVVGRAFGFIGSMAVVVLFLILLLRFMRIAHHAKDDFGMFVCVGVTAMYAFHVLENIGMAIGIMPCTGIPLPLISYGGTSVITNLVAIGLVLNVGMRKQMIRF